MTWAAQCPEHAWVLGVGGPVGAEVEKGLAGWGGQIWQTDPRDVRAAEKSGEWARASV